LNTRPGCSPGTGHDLQARDQAGYMTNARGWATSIKAEGIVRSCTGDGRIPLIDPGDIADVVATVLLTDAYDRAELPVTGLEALSFAQMTAEIAAAIGRLLAFRPVTEREARERQITAGEDAAWVDDVDLPIWRAIRQGLLAEVTVTPALFVSVVVTDSVERGRELLGAFAEASYGMPLDQLEKIQALLAAGPPDMVAEKLRGYVAAGARHLAVRIATTSLESRREQLEHIIKLKGYL
jgi:hypothetical protein